MTGFVLDPRSISNLAGVHADLVKVVNDCILHWERAFHFGVTQGLRTVAQEQKYVAMGRSQTLHSRHLDGHAIDLVVLFPPDNEVVWTWHLYQLVADDMKAASARVGVPIQWGGDWKTLADGTHFQLPFDKYPSEGAANGTAPT